MFQHALFNARRLLFRHDWNRFWHSSFHPLSVVVINFSITDRDHWERFYLVTMFPLDSGLLFPSLSARTNCQHIPTRIRHLIVCVGLVVTRTRIDLVRILLIVDHRAHCIVGPPFDGLLNEGVCAPVSTMRLLFKSRSKSPSFPSYLSHE